MVLQKYILYHTTGIFLFTYYCGCFTLTNEPKEIWFGAVESLGTSGAKASL